MVVLPTVPYFPWCPMSWPHCPASRPFRMPNVPFFGRGQIVLKKCSKCMRDRNVLASKLKSGMLGLRKIMKIGATRCHILKLNCIKFDFGWGSAPDPAGGAYSPPPDIAAGFKSHTSKGRREKGRERKKWKGKGGVSFSLHFQFSLLATLT